MIERSLVLLKPDALQRALVGKILSRFEQTGFKIVGMKMCYASKDVAGKHYADDEAWLISVGEKSKKAAESKGQKITDTPKALGQKVREMLIEFITSSPTVAICLEGHDVINKVRTIIGDTAPSKAAPGTIRGDYSFDSYGLADFSGRPIQNLIHASDSPDSAKREISIWFKNDEIHPYQRVDESLLYRKGK
jgi:nucleoside-diphosphate kinase